jgi:hypothetical protein
LRALFDASVQREVLNPLTPKSSPRPVHERFSRLGPMVRQSESYTTKLTPTAPIGITESPICVPFEVLRKTHTNNAPTAFLAGYFDVTTKAVLLHDAVAGKYVAAAEHPFIKARRPAKST